jgi:hypothetical protein
MITLRTFTNQAEASFCVSFLQAHGFDAVLLDEGPFAWNFAGPAIPIRLQVPEEQREAAISCLDRADAQSGDSDANPDATSTI